MDYRGRRMINEKGAKRFCSEDISLIENYNEAISDEEKMWDIHHRRECDENGRTYRFLVFLIFSLLHLACDRGNLEIVQTLFKYDVNFTMKDQDDLLPLDYACICQQYDIIEYLSRIQNHIYNIA